jgi:NADH-ubiquinone oxidoreductase chain 5
MGRRITSISFMINIIIVANLSLCGLPFLRGFYSKDLILEMILIMNNRILFFIIIIVATLLTISYSFRILILLVSKPNHSECFFLLIMI